MIVDRELRGKISRGASESELVAEVELQGTRTLREDGIRRVQEGVTTLEEVLAATVEA